MQIIPVESYHLEILIHGGATRVSVQYEHIGTITNVNPTCSAKNALRTDNCIITVVQPMTESFVEFRFGQRVVAEKFFHWHGVLPCASNGSIAQHWQQVTNA